MSSRCFSAGRKELFAGGFPRLYIFYLNCIPFTNLKKRKILQGGNIYGEEMPQMWREKLHCDRSCYPGMAGGRKMESLLRSESAVARLRISRMTMISGSATPADTMRLALNLMSRKENKKWEIFWTSLSALSPGLGLTLLRWEITTSWFAMQRKTSPSGWRFLNTQVNFN